MFLHMVRLVFLVVVLSITTGFVADAMGDPKYASKGTTHMVMLVLLPALAAAGLILVDMFWKRKRLQVLSGLFFGVLAGLTLAYAMNLIVDLVVSMFNVNEGVATVQLVKVLLDAAAVFICVTFVLQTKDDFRFVIPYVEFSKETKGARPLLLDTSVIIDGRIADISDTRILESTVIVPRFVLAELQAIADSDDKLKRNRGRRGLDILNRLQGSDKIDIRILDAHAPGVEAAGDVDAKLVALAEHMNGRVVTNDYNLNKVAQLRGVVVININDLANALKPIVLPGERMTVKVMKPGEEPGQGVGYLEDGTMVVAEQGRNHVGEDVTLTVTSVLQTSAGRMIFGRVEGESTYSRGRRRT